MDNLQRIAYCLSASGTLLTPDLNHLVYANDGTLTEEVWDPASGETLKVEEIGQGVKFDAPAAYVWYSNSTGGEEEEYEGEGIDGGERMIFSVTPDNRLIGFKYDYEEDDIWKNIDYGNIGGIEVHPETGLAAALNPDSLYLFFVNPEGRLQAATGTDITSWALTHPFDAEPRIGTPLTTNVTSDGCSLFYFAVDDTLHYLHRAHDSQDWIDYKVDNIVVDTPVTRFRASLEQGKVEAYVLTEGRLFQLSESGQPVEIGTVEGRQLSKHNNAQNIRWVARGCRPTYYRVRYIVVYHYWVPRVRGWCW
ncbi:hypothetical protein TWF281_003604 [Arthrobotrys megalospora]